MTDPLPTKRAACATCLRPQAACICRWIAPVAPRVELLVLQHPLEVANAKNSARLLHLCVAGSVLEAGEAFEPRRLDALLHGGGREPLLLYPDTPGVATPGVAAPGVPAPGMASATAPDPALLESPARLRLVVLDATWRKSRKMLYLNPALQRLPRLALREVPASAYGRLRKAHAPDQLSTLEAAALALRQLEGDAVVAQALLAAFDGFVGQQAARLPVREPSGTIPPRSSPRSS